MTEQPKFQRRNRRGAGVPAEPPKRPEPKPQYDASMEDLEALIAEKEALLQLRAEREAERPRQAEIEAERLRTAEVARQAELQREAELEAQKRRDAELETERRIAAKKAAALEAEREKQRLEAEHEAETARAAQARQKESAAKPKAPLVLASAPKKLLNDPEECWRSIDRFPLDERRLDERHVITALRTDPSHTRFDILRTRMLQALAENGWKRVAITSPTKDCGKTFTAANLAISLSRQENCRTVLLDLDMRNPSLHKIFGVRDTGAIGDMLREEIAPDAHLQGFASNSISAGSHVAIGFNGIVEPYAAELLQDPSTQRVLNQIEEQFAPDVMLFDLPPALLNDDVIAMRPHMDALLIVAAGGMTKANDIKETERRIGENIPLLGVVLNKAEQAETGDYTY
ncbi:MAG: P-loop NTPase [Marivita sp.]|uniref:CpsD/CapB family tyrosine-protein kinase n=1 Tax=Marivita sp. TaxID=2003365 RepID=UPI003EFACF8E